MLCTLLLGCASSDRADDSPGSDETAATASSVTSDVLVSETPDATDASNHVPTSTTLATELACLSDALASHLELLTYLDGSADSADATPIDALRALLVARTCLPEDVLHEMVASALGAQVDEPLTDFQVQCLTDLLLSLPDEDLAALLDASPEVETTAPAPDGTEVAARMLRLCGIEGS